MTDRTHSLSVDAALDHLAEVLGPKGFKRERADIAPFEQDWTGQNRGRALAVALPDSRDGVVDVVTTCRRAGIPLVPQGGNTGLSDGSIPDDSGKALVLSLRRLNRVHRVDPVGNVADVDAGVILEDLHRAAEAEGRFFPLSLGAKGSCLIGGNIATNAGGINVLRYGNTRDLVLGLEVVLPDGRVLDSLTPLRKDNTGYDLKQLFIGAEGTLGIITRATVKLFPRPDNKATAMLGLMDAAAITRFYKTMTSRMGEVLNSFELVSARAMEAAANMMGDATPRLDTDCPWYVITEVATSDPDAVLEDKLEALLADAFEDETIVDGIVARSLEQRNTIWKMRESITEGQGRTLRHDISVSIAEIPAFIARLHEAVEAELPGVEVVNYGHVGDGNLHFNVVVPEDWSDADLAGRGKAISGTIYQVVADFDGSFSAEHGVGRAKKYAFETHKDPVAQSLMRALKEELDPDGFMHPGVMLP
ncbi:FAD-binding oxidoreductase [Yunchengibacter salinarum]|uniref:FAD-binding oxidoreductase n=1 Tax=Yunchengibacter salinarum TaxID=3133399 RepID=UPI0035B645BF